MRAVAALDPPPGAVLVSGDIAEHGDAHEYERARELLAPLSMPVHVLAGNLDDRDALAACFGSGASDYYHYSARCGPLRLVACDTTRPGRDDGRMDPDRLAWLEAELAADRETPTILAMHHPPIAIGIRAMDEIGLPEPDRLAIADLLARNPQVRRVVAGHVHRTVFGQLDGRVVFTCPSTYVQTALDLSGSDRLSIVREPPGFAVHVAHPGGARHPRAADRRLRPGGRALRRPAIGRSGSARRGRSCSAVAGFGCSPA